MRTWFREVLLRMRRTVMGHNYGGWVPFVYIAGPYTSGDPVANVDRAIQVADRLATAYHVHPIVPHLTHFWHIRYPHSYRFWMRYCLEMLVRQADVLLRLPGESRGADEEVEVAKRYGIPVVYSTMDLLDWLIRVGHVAD